MIPVELQWNSATCPWTSKVKASPNIRSEVLTNVGNDKGDIISKKEQQNTCQGWKTV